MQKEKTSLSVGVWAGPEKNFHSQCSIMCYKRIICNLNEM